MANNPYLKNAYSGVATKDTPMEKNVSNPNVVLKTNVQLVRNPLPGVNLNGTTEIEETEGNVLNTNYALRPNVQQVANTTQNSNKGNAFQKQYTADSIMSMTQGELLLKLYDEVIKQLNISIKSIDNQDEATAEELKLMQNDLKEVEKAARKIAAQELEFKVRKKFKDEEKEITHEDIKNAVSEKAINDIIQRTGVRNFDNGGKANNEKNRELVKNRDKALDKIQKIIVHLRMTLNFDYEISNNLNSLYAFFNKCTVEARINNESKLLKEILPLVMDLREAYGEAEQNIKADK